MRTAEEWWKKMNRKWLCSKNKSEQ